MFKTRFISSMSLPAVCEYCIKINIDHNNLKDNCIKVEYGRHDYYPGFHALTKSSQNGCKVCRLFQNGIQASFQRQQPRPKAGVSEWDGGFSITSLHFYFENGILNDYIDESINGPFRLVINIEDPQIRLCRVAFDVFAAEGMLS